MKALIAARSRLPIFVLAALLGAAAGARPAAARPVSTKPASILDDPRFRVEVSRGLDRLYAMDFAAADAIFAGIDRQRPGHPVGPFLRALTPWWTILTDPDDESHDAAFLAAMDEVLARSEARLERDPEDLDGLFFKTGAHAFRGRLYSFRGRWYRAAQDGRQALRNLRRVAAEDPGNDDLYLGLGLFDYLADVVPRRHPFLKPLAAFFPKGDRRRGLAELDRALTRGRFVATEAGYARLQIDFTFEENVPASLRDVLWLRRRHPGNSVFHLYEGRVLSRARSWDRAAAVYGEIARRHERGRPGYGADVGRQALYGLARAEMQRGRYAEALPALARLDALTRRSPDTDLKVLGRLREGMAYDALGRRPDAVRCYRQVLAMQSDRRDARERARDYLARPFAR